MYEIGYTAYRDSHMIVSRTSPLIKVVIPCPKRSDTFVIERKLINKFVIISAHYDTDYQH